MKKIFIAALGALAVLSCTKTETVYNDGSEIGFFPVPQNITKGTGAIQGTNYPTDGTFAVFAYKVNNEAATAYDAADKTNVETWFEKIPFENNGSNLWHGNPSQYWPKTGSLFFAGVHPADVKDLCSYDFANANLTVNNFNQDAGTYNYEVASNDMVDLMYFDVDERASASDNNVAVTFHHALSWITVNVKSTEDAKDIYKLTSVTIESIVPQGTFNSNLGTGNTPEWTPVTGSTSTYTLTNGYTAELLNATAVSFDNALLIPQSLTDANKLVVKFVQRKSAGGEYSEEQTKEFDLSAQTADNKWKIKTHYIYNVTFDIKEILLAPDIEDWTLETEIDLPTIE